ncbi:hypothetical protein Nepgr_010675 [Nepenthes gracilis]|uniref:DUF7725 domain-containing protein n=1 Tax=Nepenthes gracilis TaxID=150966 RepID=A0AAD3XLJ6_NEPGR|nr:hypothetical protein Nepgr_010675 [Nepenthes gracilis]
MEASVGVAATQRGGSLPLPPSQPPSRKEWRAVSEHSVRNTGSEQEERSKFGKSDERTIYEVQQGRGPLDVVDFSSIQMDGIGGLDDGMLQQRIHDLGRQREELQQVEIELRAQMIARLQIREMQHNFDAQIKEQTNVTTKLQEQLREREQTIHDLERKMEVKERELLDIRLDNEAAWAKEDLLREQNKELANFRREHANIEVERSHHIKQIHDLQEHTQDKERQLMELQEQHRIAQDTILYKDEQLRETQAWITRIQEMDALQSSTNHSLQAELRERVDQYNQLWLVCQRQFAEMERLHMQAIQQLQLELAGARENNGSYNEESRMSQTNSNDVSQFPQNNGSHVEANGSGMPKGNSAGLSNGNSDNSQSFISSGNIASQSNHVPGVPITPPSLLGVPSFLPPGQLTALHPYVMHQQGANHPVPSHVPQSHVGHFHPMSAISSFQQWLSQQAVTAAPQISTQNQFPHSQAEELLSRPDSNFGYEISVNGHGLHPDYLNVPISQGMDSSSVISTAEEAQGLRSIDKSYLDGPQGQQSLQQISSQFQESLRLDALEQTSEVKAQENDAINLTNDESESRMMKEKVSPAASPLPAEKQIHQGHFSDTRLNNATDAVLSAAFVSTGQTNSPSMKKASDTTLLDERSLLACIVRTIPAGGKIHISSTLPNRLGKMLAPLHWQDYKKKYGKLDDFVAGHPELFLIEGDYIQLRDGAQGIIAATAAVAKVAAAAAASSPYSSSFPSVAVTPMAQANRLKKVPSMDSKPPRNGAHSSSQLSPMQSQHSNGVGLNISGGLSNVKILSKSQDSLVFNGLALATHQLEVHLMQDLVLVLAVNNTAGPQLPHWHLEDR